MLAWGISRKQQHWSVFIFHFSGKFAIQRPSSNAYFDLRIQEEIMSGFWHRVGRRRFSISIALTKPDFNVHAVSACICNSATVVEKRWIICRRISRISKVSLRDSYDASVKKERLFESRKNRCMKRPALIYLHSTVRKETESWRRTTLLAKCIKIVHLVFSENFNGRHKKIVPAFP